MKRFFFHIFRLQVSILVKLGDITLALLGMILPLKTPVPIDSLTQLQGQTVCHFDHQAAAHGKCKILLRSFVLFCFSFWFLVVVFVDNGRTC